MDNYEMKSFKSKKLYFQVYEELKNYIIRNNLQPGDKLPTEQEISQKMGISRNVIREAIKTLEITGVVKSTTGIGMVVQELNMDFIFSCLVYSSLSNNQDTSTQIRHIRRVLELGFSKEAFDSLTPKDILELQDYVNEMKHIAEERKNLPVATFGPRFSTVDAAFHRTLFKNLNMPVLISLIDSFWAYNKNYNVISDYTYIALTVEKHERILNALIIKDYNKFHEALDFHYSHRYAVDSKDSVESLSKNP